MDKIGRYSEALDAQVELLNYWTQPENRGLYEYVLVDMYGMDRGFVSLMLDFTVDALKVAEPFYVSPAICELLFNAARSIPRSWTLTDYALYRPSGFVWLATPLHTHQEEGPTLALVWATMALTKQGRYLLPTAEDPGERGIAFGFFEQIGNFSVLVPMSMGLWKFGGDLQKSDIEDAERPEEADQHRCLFATIMTFLQQRILIASKYTGDRAARRRLEKASVKPPSQEVSVIELRRAVYLKGERHRDVEWTCRWIVTGHWRNQWYPSKHEYRPKYIASYLKGPEDKPLRHPERLFAVVR